MFLTDLLPCGYLLHDELFADDTLYFAHFALLAHIDDGNGNSGFPGTSGTSATVGITFRIVWQAVIDHVCKVVYVQSACGYVCSYKDLDIPLAELLHNGVTLRL